MSQKPLSQAYVEHYKNGPFLGKIDPWAEQARYFHAIHGGMIDALLDAIQDRLIAMGYQAGRETSLQIVDNRQPDIYVQQENDKEQGSWSYDAAATALQVEAGIELVLDEPELDAITINRQDTGELITVIEIISPRNKTHQHDMYRYIQQRNELFLAQGVNVVEIDPTRSVQRLIQNKSLKSFAYHIAIFLPEEGLRLLGNKVDEPLQPFALPLRDDAIRVETQDAYDDAYRTMTIASQIHSNRDYILEALPFPSTLTDAQKTAALQAVKQWQAQLEQLREDRP